MRSLEIGSVVTGSYFWLLSGITVTPGFGTIHLADLAGGSLQ